MKRVLLALVVWFVTCAACVLAGDIRVPEGESGALQITPVSALSSALADTTTVNYHGAPVRSIYVNQPALAIIKVAEAQAQFGYGSGVVAVIDTGIDPYHPALRGSLVAGYDFTRRTAGAASEWLDLSPSQVAALAPSASVAATQKTVAAIVSTSAVPILDQSTVVILDGGGATLPGEFGHGTMVAGLIHLVAPAAKIMPLKAFRADGSANLPDVVNAIRYAADHGANVINMSFSVTSPDSNLKSAINYAVSKGVVCVAAAGNDGRQAAVYPAAYTNVIGVGSVNNSDLRSLFSNYDSSAARTSAPGEALITTYPGNNYAGVWGTSFSAALVSGAAALAVQISSKGAPEAIYHGQPIEQDMGDTRLQILRGLTHMVTELTLP